jgi:hypothetical protein
VTQLVPTCRCEPPMSRKNLLSIRSNSPCDYVKRPGRLDGFLRRGVRDDVYPVIIPSDLGAWVDGFAYFGVSETDLRCVDRFGGDADDRKTHTVVVEGGEKRKADAYVLKEHCHSLANSQD